MGTATKTLGYFGSAVIIIIGVLLVVGAMQVTIFHGIFLLILALAVIIGGCLLMRAVYRRDTRQQREEMSSTFDSYCNKCGMEVDEGSAFCSSCGNQLDKTGGSQTNNRSPL